MYININRKNTSGNSSSRRKFVLRLGAALSSLAVLAAAIKLPASLKKGLIACKPEGHSKKIKMLTQDGKLVEIDESLISSNRKKISDQELQHWVKNKKASK